MTQHKKVIVTICASCIAALLIFQNYYPIYSIFNNRMMKVLADENKTSENVEDDENNVDKAEEEKGVETGTEKNDEPVQETDDETTIPDEKVDSKENEDTSQKTEKTDDKKPIDNKAPIEIKNEEFRATWVSTIYNLDWPSKKGLSISEQKGEFISLLNGLQKAGLNAVIVQVKPTADSFYPSAYGPWSEYLTGVQGKNPGYDPLAFMIEETHKRGMEFHAWFNPYRVSVKDDIEALVEDHPARKNPDWVVSYGGKLYYNPGVPEARQFVIDSILEVVKKYNVDGVHLDDYFYPYPEKGVAFPDDDLYNTNKRRASESKEEWRRDNINDFIKNLYGSIKTQKKNVAFGVSPFGIWRNKSDDVKGSDTRGGVTSYDSLHADTKYWIEQGWLDYIAPQVYWHFGYDRADYKKTVDWWVNVTKNKKPHLYIGHAAYKLEESNTPWGNPLEIANQIEYNRTIPGIKGSIFFRAKSIINNQLGFTDKLQNELYKQKAKTPKMP